MKASELRLGNLYWYQMYDKQDECERWLEQSIIDTDDLIWLVGNPDDPDFMPIQITEEWLLKFGFKFAPETYVWWINSNIGVFKLQTEEDKISFDWWSEILFVHQLQNLFHSLTGEELKFTSVIGHPSSNTP